MKIGTDFSGIGSPEMALKLLNIEHEQVFACEIDKYARKSFEAIHGNPHTFYKDITKRDHSEIPQLDLYVAGFPCQAFSMAGKRKGFDDVRGTLFFNVAEFIKINQPKCFILENVKGLLSHDSGKTFQTIISLLTDNGGTANGQIFIPYFEDGLGYHVYYKVLNTKDYGIPQNRERIFIIGFKEFRQFSFPKPFPLELRLKDMLQDNPDYKYFLSDKQLHSIKNSKHEHSARIHDIDGFSPTIMAKSGGGHEPYIEMPIDDKYFLSDKMVESFTNHKERHKEKGTGFQWQPKEGDDIANALRANAALCPTDNSLKTDQYKIRRLTPLECFRLQGFPDDAFFRAEKVNSDTQLYKQAGNSITTCVMVQLFKKILCLE
jgi:DNA (cytosine-5)-methyltransferase 1